jgi:hypothetical protein
LVGKSEGKKPLGRPRRRWKNNIRMDVREKVGKCGLDSSEGYVAEVEGCCEHVYELSGSIKSRECLD